jgi:hypothetical protein
MGPAASAVIDIRIELAELFSDTELTLQFTLVECHRSDLVVRLNALPDPNIRHPCYIRSILLLSPLAQTAFLTASRLPCV